MTKCRRVISFVVSAIATSILGGELLLQATHSDDPVNRNTMNAPDYKDVGQGGNAFHPGGLLAPNKALEVFDGYGSTVPWRTNSAGFRSDREFDRERKPNTFRMLSLGDCFSVGYRVGQGKAFPDLAGKQIELETGHPCETMIAHTRCPALAVSYMKEFGRSWNPDAIMVNTSIVNDVTESYLTLNPTPIGFMDLFEGNELPNRCRIRLAGLGPVPWSWEWFKSNSKLLSAVSSTGWPVKTWYESADDPYLLDPNQGLGFFMLEANPLVEEAWRRYFWALSKLSARCQEWKIALVLVIVPLRFQIFPKDWAATCSLYGLKPQAFDLRLPNRRISEFCRKNGMAFIDGTDRLASQAHEGLYLPDGEAHWNEAGHRAFLDVIWEDLSRALPPHGSRHR